MSVRMGPTRAELGRDTWTLIHARADCVSDDDALDDFVAYAANTVDRYPCVVCREHVLSRCASLVKGLHFLQNRAHSMMKSVPGVPVQRVVAVAWAAKLHACVTTGLRSDPKAVVSSESDALARSVIALGDKDAAIFSLIIN